MGRYLLPLIVSATLLFTGCSSKEVFKPENTVGSWPSGPSLSNDIVDVTFDGAQLEEGEVLSRDGITGVTIPEGYRFVGISDGRVIAATVDGKLLLISEADHEARQELELKKTVAGASVQGDTLAVLFADNSMALYSLSSQSLLMKERGVAPLAVDNRIVNPYFFNDLVLFPTLDGKVVIIHAGEKKRLRSIIVSSEEHFNNVIYLKLIGNTIVAATSSTLFALADKEVREKYDIRDVAFTKDGIWVTTKQGEVVALTPSMQVVAKQKFPFAHFLGMIVSDNKVFVLEKEGYLLALDKDLANYKVYDADVEEGFVYAGNKAFYFESESLPVEK
jgi:outer membrane protein assembly factor BamB